MFSVACMKSGQSAVHYSRCTSDIWYSDDRSTRWTLCDVGLRSSQ